MPQKEVMKLMIEKSLPEKIIETILNRKLVIAGVFLLVVISGMAVTFLITPKYEASMSILISRETPDPQISASLNPVQVERKEISDEEFNSELEMIKSGKVIAGAVRELNLANDQLPINNNRLSRLRAAMKDAVASFSSEKTEAPATNKPVDDSAVEGQIGRVSGNLSVVPVKASRVINLSYTDTDPRRAKETLAKIYENYAELHEKLNETLRSGEKIQAGKVFQQQTADFNRKLQSTTNRLKSFDKQNGLSGTDINTQQELLLKQLYDAQNQLNATRTEIVENQRQIDDLGTKVKEQPEQIQVGSSTKYVSALDKMKEDLLALEQQRTQLLQKYQPASRPVRDNEERIQQLKSALQREMANPPQEKSFALNDLRRKLMTDLMFSQTRLAALREREKSLTPLVDDLKNKSLQLNSQTIERAGIERERGVNEESYLMYQKKLRENDINLVLSKQPAISSQVIDTARADDEPINPKPMLNLLVLSAVGLTVGFAAAIALDRFQKGADTAYVSVQQIEQHFGLPVLAIISEIEPPKIKTIQVKAKPLLLQSKTDEGF